MCVGVHMAVILFVTGYPLRSLLYELLDLRRVSLLSLPPVSWFGYVMILGYAVLLCVVQTQQTTDTCATVSAFMQVLEIPTRVIKSCSVTVIHLPSWNPASSDPGQWPANT